MSGEKLILNLEFLTKFIQISFFIIGNEFEIPMKYLARLFIYFILSFSNLTFFCNKSST